MLAEGTYTATATEHALSTSKNGNIYIQVSFEVEGQKINWRGFFTDATKARTVQSLRFMGWQGNDINDLDLPNEVELVIAHEEYNGKTYARVNWVNKIGGGPKPPDPLAGEEKNS